MFIAHSRVLACCGIWIKYEQFQLLGINSLYVKYLSILAQIDPLVHQVITSRSQLETNLTGHYSTVLLCLCELSAQS